jgi:hypothetical protein
MVAIRRGASAVPIMLLAIVIAGCATRTTHIDERMLFPASGARHETDARGFFVMPMTLASPQPAFPVSAAGTGTFEVTVCAEIWLSANGDITRVAAFDGAPGCAAVSDPQAQPYARSVADALQRWEFTPAMVCEFPTELLGKRGQGDCTGPEVVVRQVPVRLNYAFTFSTRDGRRRINFARGPRTGETPARRDSR